MTADSLNATRNGLERRGSDPFRNDVSSNVLESNPLPPDCSLIFFWREGTAASTNVFRALASAKFSVTAPSDAICTAGFVSWTLDETAAIACCTAACSAAACPAAGMVPAAT